MDSEGVTVKVVGGSVGAVVLVGVAGMLALGNSLAVALASGIEGLMLSCVSFVGAATAKVDLTESVHISDWEGGTVLEGVFESGTEIVSKEGGAVAQGTGASGVAGAAVTLGLAVVLVSPSSISTSSFSGVLRPDVVGGGPGLRTGFGSKAGFPADS